LKINFQKSVVASINSGDEETQKVRELLKCTRVKLSIKYLGIPLGGRSKESGDMEANYPEDRS
ncbi:hypothetical protein PIB30_081793, partial [Stylosanthes scabra]|nr:hypothetical protein [Stylosanthes scabra]